MSKLNWCCSVLKITVPACVLYDLAFSGCFCGFLLMLLSFVFLDGYAIVNFLSWLFIRKVMNFGELSADSVV